MLEYRVLGGFGLRHGDRERDGHVNVGGPRQRRLAAVLLVNRNRVVSVDRLMEAVFAGAPTPGAAKSLRSYVARLRRVVEREGTGCRVVTEPPGYRLEVGDEAVDAARFEAALTDGRALLARGEAGAAADAVRAGLGLWRGEAYAEFADEDWARGEAHRLAELRLVAYEELADAEMAAGRPGEAVSLLDGLVTEFPLREAFQARLMLALYRSGRHVEALRVYQQHRDLLGGEVGVEPSPELAELEARILAHDPSLTVADTGGAGLRGYRLAERLGTGRDGTVFAARLPGVDRDLAVRVVPPALADAPGFVRAFESEARRLASLRREAVVPVLDWWREPGAAYVVMRRMRGGTLRDRLHAGPLEPGEVARLVSRVGGALVAAANLGIPHGRVCAESVLFDEAGDAFLGDFPLGSAAEPAERSGADDLAALAGLAAEAVGGQPVGPGPNGAGDETPARRHAGALAALVDGVPFASRSSPHALADFVAAAVASLSDAEGVASPRANPYKGLRAFDEPDADDFFGRDRVVDEIVARLGAGGAAGRFALVVGSSGCGKSSIVRAGLLPRVREGAVPGSAAWFVATMTPGKQPFEQLVDALRLVAVGGVGDLPGLLAAGDRGLHDAVGRALPPGVELLLVVDQLEELFTLAPEADQRSFLDALTEATSAPDSRVRVVATLRADFYDRPLRFERLAASVGDATVVVGAMSASELEAAIVGPTERVGGTVEPALVAELVGAVHREPAALPALQFTLTELADESPDGTLTLAGYRRLGGVDAAIAARAEALYLTLAPEARTGVRRMFEQLVVVAPAGEPTRRRALATEVDAVVQAQGSESPSGLVEDWAQARLLTLDRHPDSRAPTVEVAHEALLREWPRLRDWVEEDRDELVALGHLRDAAAGWEGLARDAGALYRGARLEAALHVVGRRGRVLPAAERAFLDASRAERDAERRREARRVRRLRAQLAVVGLALVVSLVAGAIAVGQRSRAEDARAAAERQSNDRALQALVAEAGVAQGTKRDRAALLALAAYEIDPRPETFGALLGTFTAAPHVVRTIRVDDMAVRNGALLPDGRTFAVVDDHAGVRLVDLSTGRTVGTLAPTDHELGHVRAAAVSPDGRWLAVAGEPGPAPQPRPGPPVLVVRDLATGERRFPDVTPGVPTGSLAVSPDGRLLAVAGGEGPTSVEVRSMADGHLVRAVPGLPEPPGTVRNAFTAAVTFLPGGQLVVTSEHGDLRVVDPRTGAELRRHPGPQEVASRVAQASADGQVIYAAGPEGASAWSVDGGLLWAREERLECADLAIDARGGRLLCGTEQGEVVGYALEDGSRSDEDLDYQHGETWVLDVTPDGRTLVQAGGPVVATWRLDGGGAVSTPMQVEDRLMSPAGFAGPSRLLMHRGLTRDTALVDIRTGEVVDALTGITSAVVVDEETGLLAAQYTDGTGGLYDPRRGGGRVDGSAMTLPFVPTGALPLDERVVLWSDSRIQGMTMDGLVPPSVTVEPGTIRWLAMSADGTRFFTLEGADLVQRDLGGRPTGRVRHGIQEATTSADLTVVATTDGRLDVLDAETLDPLGSFAGVDNPTWQLDLDDAGERLLIQGKDQTVRLADVATRRFLGGPIDMGAGPPFDWPYGWSVLRGDGEAVAIQTDRGTVVWDLDPDKLAEAACAVAGRNLTEAEWRDDIGSLAPFRSLCPPTA